MFQKLFSILLLFTATIFGLFSCSSDEEAQKRAEATQIVESRSSKQQLEDLYLGAEGDIEALARVLGTTPSVIERIKSEKTIPTEKFAERIKEVDIYYMQNEQMFSKLRSILDPEYAWWEAVLHFHHHHAVLFWTINIILLILLAFVALIDIWPILAELLIYLVAWICSLIWSPAPVVDNYVEQINPVMEQLM